MIVASIQRRSPSTIPITAEVYAHVEPELTQETTEAAAPS